MGEGQGGHDCVLLVACPFLSHDIKLALVSAKAGLNPTRIWTVFSPLTGCFGNCAW